MACQVEHNFFFFKYIPNADFVKMPQRLRRTTLYSRDFTFSGFHCSVSYPYSFSAFSNFFISGVSVYTIIMSHGGVEIL